jgi:GMP synthase PP-ATPase subunit
VDRGRRLDKDLKFGDAEKLTEDVARIKGITDDIARITPLRTEFIEDFDRHSETLTETRYSDGGRVYANYSEMELLVEGVGRVPAKGFLVAG